MQKNEQVDKYEELEMYVEIILYKFSFETILLWKLKLSSWYSIQVLNILILYTLFLVKDIK